MGDGIKRAADKGGEITMRGNAKRRRGLLVFCLVMLVGGPKANAQEEGVKLTPFRDEIVFNFQNERGPQVRVVRLDMSEPTSSSPTAILLGDFTSTTGPHVIPIEDVTTEVSSDADTETVELSVEVNPSISAWKAGEFTSSIRIGGEGFESITTPLKLKFRSGSPLPGAGVAILVILLGVGIGYLFKANESNPTTPDTTNATEARKSVIRWAPILTGAVTVIAVVIFGFDAEYLNDDIFGSGGFSDWLALLAWGYAAGFSGKTVSDYTVTKASP